MPASIHAATPLVEDAVQRERRDRDSGGIATTAAQVTRDQWQHFLDVYKPLENQVLERAMQTDFSAEGDRASSQVQAGLASAAGTYERNLRRAGTALTSEERTALARRRSTSGTRAKAGAENLTRRSLRESRTNMLADIVGIGRGVARTASGGLNTVADLEAQRAIFNEQSKSAAFSQNLSTAASLAAYGIMFL